MDKNQEIIDKQIEVAINRYGFNMPKSLARAKAKKIVNEAMKTYNGSTGLSTYLSSKLQKLSRDSYKRSSMFDVPEKTMILRKKVRDFIDEYRDTYGEDPSDQTIMSKFRISSGTLRNVNTLISSGVSNGFEKKTGNKLRLSNSVGVQNVQKEYRGLASDIYKKNLSNSEIMKKRRLGKTTFFKQKKIVDGQLKRVAEFEQIDYV